MAEYPFICGLELDDPFFSHLFVRIFLQHTVLNLAHWEQAAQQHVFFFINVSHSWDIH